MHPAVDKCCHAHSIAHPCQTVRDWSIGVRKPLLHRRTQWRAGPLGMEVPTVLSLAAQAAEVQQLYPDFTALRFLDDVAREQGTRRWWSSPGRPPEAMASLQRPPLCGIPAILSTVDSIRTRSYFNKHLSQHCAVLPPATAAAAVACQVGWLAAV